MTGESPYRKQFDAKAESERKYKEAVRKMEKEIAAEGKSFSIQLPEKIKVGDIVPFFEDALKNKINPKDIVFYSLATGILRYTGQEPYSPKRESCFYANSSGSIKLDVYLKKEHPSSAKIYNLSIKADTNIQDPAQEYIQHIKRLVEVGTDEDLRDLRTDLERILFTINDKLEAAKKKE